MLATNGIDGENLRRSQPRKRCGLGFFCCAVRILAEGIEFAVYDVFFKIPPPWRARSPDRTSNGIDNGTLLSKRTLLSALLFPPGPGRRDSFQHTAASDPVQNMTALAGTSFCAW